MSSAPSENALGIVSRRDVVTAAVTAAADLFNDPEPWESVIGEVLSRLGSAMEVDRAYIFHVELRSGINYAYQRFEWCKAGVIPQIDNPELQGIPLEDVGYRRWVEVLAGGAPIFGDIDDFPESERPLLEAQGIKSILVQPLLVSGRLGGFIGFDSCAATTSWLRYEVDLLRIVALLVSAAIEREILARQLAQSLKFEALSRISRVVAHDLNNLLMVMHTAAQLMRSEFELLNVQMLIQCCAMLDQAVLRAQTLTSQLLEFTKKPVHDLQLISPLALLEREEPLIRGSLKPTVRLRISPQEHGRPVLPVWLQPSDFSQILLNLSLNANDAMPHGGTLTFEVFTVDSTELPASTDQIPPGTWTLVRVTDSGEGMSSEVMEQAFDPFFTTRPPETYTGLGLTTVRELMNNAGGRIALSSTVGAGTEFRLYYPVSGPSPAATIATRD